ncbi:MAG TPA: ABC transporter substrate-binding protein [Burkholderiales bacterium]
MKRRELLIALGLAPLAAALAAHAQQKGKVWRLGFLSSASASAYAYRVEALRAGLRDLGYVEGRNISIEFRWAEGNYERLHAFAAELVRLKVDIILTHGTPGAQAAKKATTSIPIIVSAISDPVATGLVASLRRPGGNLTGLMFFTQELNEKRLELVKEVFPNARRIAILANPDNESMKPIIPALESAARVLKFEFRRFDVRRPAEFGEAFSAMATWRAEAIVPIEDAMLLANDRELVDQAARRNVPIIGWNEIAEKGGLLAYGVDFVDISRRSASYVDRILKGANPGELPVDRSTKYELVINMKTVKSLGVKLPQSVLVRADRVIE